MYLLIYLFIYFHLFSMYMYTGIIDFPLIEYSNSKRQDTHVSASTCGNLFRCDFRSADLASLWTWNFLQNWCRLLTLENQKPNHQEILKKPETPENQKPETQWANERFFVLKWSGCLKRGAPCGGHSEQGVLAAGPQRRLWHRDHVPLAGRRISAFSANFSTSCMS